MGTRPLQPARRRIDPDFNWMLTEFSRRPQRASHGLRFYELPIKYPVKKTRTPPTMT